MDTLEKPAEDWLELPLYALMAWALAVLPPEKLTALEKEAYRRADAEHCSHNVTLPTLLRQELALYCPRCGTLHGYRNGTQARPCQACSVNIARA